MKRTPLKRRKPLKRIKPLRRTSPLKKAGKRTLAWAKARASLKIKFYKASITTCELGFPGCFRDNYLGFAHAKKRRNITTEEELKTVILACNACHDIIESMPESRMGEIVHQTINKRRP